MKETNREGETVTARELIEELQGLDNLDAPVGIENEHYIVHSINRVSLIPINKESKSYLTHVEGSGDPLVHVIDYTWPLRGGSR